jgi:hypothetical protein
MKPTLDQKRNAVYQYLCTQDRSFLASFAVALMYNDDIEDEYKKLPREFKVKITK